MDEQLLQAAMAMVPGAQSVTLKQNRAGETTETSIDGALRRPVDVRLQSYGGVQLEGGEIIWKLPASLVPQDIIPQGDKITDAAGVDWKVISAKELLMQTQWECLCRQMGK